MPGFLPLKLRRLNANADAEPITTETSATEPATTNEFFIHVK